MPASLLQCRRQRRATVGGDQGDEVGVRGPFPEHICTDEMGEPRKSRTEAVEERNRVETGLHVSSSQRNLLNRKHQASR